MTRTALNVVRDGLLLGRFVVVIPFVLLCVRDLSVSAYFVLRCQRGGEEALE
jgi:hypothetical protein